MIDTNLEGVFLSMKYELPHIINARGAIVNMSSVAGPSGRGMGAAYTASKHGVIGLTKSAAAVRTARRAGQHGRASRD